MAGRSPLFASLLLAAALAAPAAAQKAGPAAAPVPDNLPARHREFLEEAAPLLSGKERDAFLGLQQEYQRDAFIRRFWEVRDPFPQTPGNELQQAWAERAKIARERFGGLADERARILLLNGPPAEVFPGRCSQVLVPLEIWSYPGTDKIKGAFNLVFYSPQGSIKGPFR
ncbi:MAG TPA: GWxTD domain-containing protein, partial [Thermoanaerobaculia bacterium]|nr:GWxTD domain-containing protein [Thermoanaerobaculia bacterium]